MFPLILQVAGEVVSPAKVKFQTVCALFLAAVIFAAMSVASSVEHVG